MTFRSLLGAFALALAVPPSAWALVPIPLSVEQLNRQADLVVRGTVVEKTCQRDADGRIYTEVVLQVAETWRGAAGGDRITIVHGGGVLGNRVDTAVGQVHYALREEVVAFLIRNPRGEPVTVAMAQGKFHLEQVGEPGRILASNPFHQGTVEDKAAGRVWAPRVPVEELKRRVQEAAR